jgi:hypothetical protein
MKPLLISFFVVILCYSLFFERRETPVHIDEINYTNKAESFDTLKVSDPAIFYSENIHPVYFDISNKDINFFVTKPSGIE